MSTVAADPGPLAPPDEDIGPVLIMVTGVLQCFALATTVLRLVTRFSLRIAGWDDYTIGLTMVLVTVRFGLQLGQIQYGNGRHRVHIGEDNYVKNNMLGWFAMVFLFAGACCLKTSICLLILRVRDTRPLKMLLYPVMAGLFVTNFGSIFVLIAQCQPTSTYWDPSNGGRCWNVRVRVYAVYVTIGEPPFPHHHPYFTACPRTNRHTT